MRPKSEVVIDLDKDFKRPLPHRYLHGYSKDDPETRFTLLLPDQGFWKARLFQFLEGGMGGSEHVGSKDIGYYIMQRYGAAYVKSNHGHIGSDLSKLGYDGLEKVAHLSNYETARLAKRIMGEFYGQNPTYTYILGGSGGGLRATILMEMYPDCYDGAVALAQAELSIITYHLSLLAKYNPALRLKFKDILDATDVDAIGDPCAVLETEEQKVGLRRLYNSGFPKGLEWQLSRPRLYQGINALAVLFEELLKLSPERVYYEEFWSKKGYAGHDGEVSDQIVEGIEGEVLEVYTLDDLMSRLAPKIEEEVSQPLVTGEKIREGPVLPLQSELLKKPVGFKGTGKFESGQLTGYAVRFKTGVLSGKSFYIALNTDDVIHTANVANGYPEGIAVGDKYLLDNRDLLALRHYHRHIITLVEDSYRPPDFLRNGRPMHPQRPRKAKDILKMKHFQTGDFKGKMISIFAAQDIAVWPPVLFSYINKVEKAKGVRLDDHYRFYIVENATHGSPANIEESFRLVSFSPMTGRAIDYIVDWVENNMPPPPSTVAELSSNYALSMPETAAQRRGMQPAISRISANGRSGCATVPLEKPVRFGAVAEAPVGNIIGYEWYCEDLDDFRWKVCLKKPKSHVKASYYYEFRKKGTYYVVLRVTSDLDGDPSVLGGGQRNLTGIRVTAATLEK